MAADNQTSKLGNAIAAAFYALFVVGVSAMMLILNAVLCLSAHSAFTLIVPDAVSLNPEIAPRLSQMFYFIAPVILMVLEWTLLDRLFRLFNKDAL